MFATLIDYVTGRSSGWKAKNSAALVTLADATTGEPYNASSGGGGGGGTGGTAFTSTATIITRPANTTTYQVGGLISETGATGLKSIATNTGSGTTARKLSVNYVSVVSSNGAAVTKGQFSVYLFSSATPSGVTFTDNSLFNPPAATLGATGVGLIGLLSASTLLPQSGTSSYGYSTTIDSRPALTEATANGNIYVALVASNAYTPISGETFSITIAGTYV